MGRTSTSYDRSLRDSYIREYGIDLTNRIDHIEGCITTNKVFCMDCTKYHTQGRGRNRKIIRVKNGCRGSDLAWENCMYRRLAMEVINNE